MNGFTNNVGFLNSVDPAATWMYNKTTFRQGLEAVAKDAGAKVLSYTSYPFEGGTSVENGDWTYYYQGLWGARAVAAENGVPFWSYVAAGGDMRDDGGAGATNPELQPTRAETFWDVNNKLAFGAKGIEWFTVCQPWYFSLQGEGNDPDRNGLIGIDGTPTPFYYDARAINKHIAAIDDVLMKSTSTGIIAIGSETISRVAGGMGAGDSLITSTDMLENISGGGDYGALVGCFDYRDTEAFYVVNYSTITAQNFTLQFKDNYDYRYVMNAEEYSGSGSSLVLHIGAGEGVLVVLEEEKDIYYTDGPNQTAEIAVTDVSGAADSMTLSGGAAESMLCDTVSDSVTLKAYGEGVVYKNGTLITPAITESYKDSVWGFTIDLSLCGVTDGDVITIGGTVYPASGCEKGRLITIQKHDYLWSNGTWSIKHNYDGHVCTDCGTIEEGYDEAQGYLQVADYKGADATELYPTKEGMLFAGWFTDDTCTTAYTESTGRAYAKYVDAGVLVALAQIEADTDYDTLATKMRLISTVDSEWYRQVGFIIEVEGSSKGAVEISSNKAYMTITAKSGGVTFTKKPQDISPKSKYFFTYTITDIPNDGFYTGIYVTPYWVTLDGTKVTGPRSFKTVDMGIQAVTDFREVEDTETNFGPLL